VRFIAIDWSGAKSGCEKKIWLAEASDGDLVRLECGRHREAVADLLLETARASSDLVVGFDFGFSAPAWFVRKLGAASAPDLWALACTEAENWLANGMPPFWGGGRGPRPALPRPEDHYRLSDMALSPVGGIQIKSLFQVGGSGSVGTGSLRGWPILHRLRSGGFSVWPFDRTQMPLVVEIYPRLLTGPVNKSRREAREAYIEKHFPGLAGAIREKAVSSEDAFDAAVSALRMASDLDCSALPVIADADILLEGVIWHPNLDLAALSRGSRT
jgi:hypothetical protein